MKLKMFLLLAMVLLIGITSATITVTLPVETSENITIVMQGGGDLVINNTYYFVVMGYDQNYYSPRNLAIFSYHSPLSNESNFTTNDTHRSAYIEWDGGAGNTRYNIFVTNISGDYTNSGGFDTGTETVSLITVTNYNITKENDGIYVIHSANLLNNLTRDLDKDLGTIKVWVDDENLNYHATNGKYAYFLERLYEEINAQGYGDYVYWDGYDFVLKGWIVVNGASATTLYLRNARMTFIKGGIHIANSNANVHFGIWLSDEIGGSYPYGVDMNFQNSRYTIRNVGDGKFGVYGSRITMSSSQGLPYFDTDTLINTYYTGGGQGYVAYNIEEFRDTFIGSNMRSTTSPVSDLKIGIGNNWGNGPMTRLRIITSASSCYSHNCRIYATELLSSTASANQCPRMYVPTAGANYSTFFYDQVYSQEYDTHDNLPYNQYFATSYGRARADSFWQYHNSIIAKVIDENGSVIENVTVTLISNGTDYGTCDEQDKTYDRHVTGNKYD